ncbi:MAG: hypothetical protein KME17_07720 [Cyanosarcina radialis HA8281-LM2]|nr:hypothetical protein [Cyanosarcina radialis HA8281-LM2]
MYLFEVTARSGRTGTQFPNFILDGRDGEMGGWGDGGMGRWEEGENF